MPPNTLRYREAALAHQASPDQLDALIQVTRPTTWIALVMALLLIAAVIAWGFLGRIPLIVGGKGLLLDAGGLRIIPAPSAGQISEMNVAEGDFVRPGQLLARIMPLEGFTTASQIDVLSPYAGQVSHVVAMTGVTVQAGETLLQISRSQTRLQALLFLPIDEGKKVRAGMAVRVSPSNVNVQRDGYILGTVVSVARFASSAAEMKQILGSDELVKIFQQGSSNFQSAPIRVDVDLGTDPTTPSGLRWTSASGPPFALESGTVCTAEITASTARPIDLVLPYLQEKFGGEKF